MVGVLWLHQNVILQRITNHHVLRHDKYILYLRSSQVDRYTKSPSPDSNDELDQVGFKFVVISKLESICQDPPPQSERRRARALASPTLARMI